MSKKEKDKAQDRAAEQPADPITELECEPVAPEPQTCEAEEVQNPLLEELETLKKNRAEQEEKFLRLAAEYDNFRKRSQKEKESLWTDAKSETALAFLPVYDNLERALKQETCDVAYSKGVEMTMTGLREVLAKLGIEEIPALGEKFDPNLHNAVMHLDDETAGESVILEVFQTGFKSGDKVIRFSMVKVAN